MGTWGARAKSLRLSLAPRVGSRSPRETMGELLKLLSANLDELWPAVHLASLARSSEARNVARIMS